MRKMTNTVVKRIMRTGAIGAVLLGALVAHADTITSKDGNVIQGTFLGSDGKTIEFQAEIGTVAVERSKVASVGFGSASAAAGNPDMDTLALKNGNVLTGTFLESDGKTIRFQGAMGQLTVEKDKVASITLAGAGAPATSAAATTAAAEPEVTLPSSTVLLVKTASNVSSKSRAGSPFETVLIADLTSDGTVVVKSGTKILGRVQNASEPRGRGQATLDIRLTEILLGGQRVKVVTSGYRAAGDKGVKQAARGAAAGAAIGGIADGGDGAAKGAAAGAAAGALKKANTINIPPGTMLEFTLVQPSTFTAKAAP